MSNATWNFLFDVASIAMIAVGAFLSYRHWRAQKRSPGHVNPEYERVSTLNGIDAEREARRLLELSTPFDAFREPLLAKDRSLLQELPTDVAALFSSWSAVAGNDMRLARSEIKPFPGDPSLTRIGADIGNADIVVRRSDGHVFVIESGDGVPSDEGYLSIWHYLLEVALHSKS